MLKLEGYGLKINVRLGKGGRRNISRNVALLNIRVHEICYIMNTEQTSENIFTYKHYRLTK